MAYSRVSMRSSAEHIYCLPGCSLITLVAIVTVVSRTYCIRTSGTEGGVLEAQQKLEIPSVQCFAG